MTIAHNCSFINDRIAKFTLQRWHRSASEMADRLLLLRGGIMHLQLCFEARSELA